MARLVGVGLHNLHSLRRLQLFSSPCPAALREFPDSKQVVKRWFGETAALEEFYNSTSSIKESLRVSKTLDENSGQGPKKESGEADKEVASEKVSIVNKSSPPSGAAASSSDIDTEKLSEYIIGKFKNSTVSNGNKGLLNKKPVGPLPSKFPFPPSRNSRLVNEKSNWKEVLEGLCDRAIKNKVANAGESTSNQSTLFRKNDGDPNDDFADLDPPQEVDKASVSVSSNGPHRPPFAAAFKKETTTNSRNKEGQLQDWNQQKTKETRTFNHESLKSSLMDWSSEIYLPKRGDPIFRAAIPDSRIVPSEDFGHKVCIQNLPVSSNLALVRDALSIYGEVTGSYRKPSPNGSCITFIEFKTYEAKEDALAARFVQLENKIFTILRVERPVTTVVRVCKVSSESSENHVLSTCGKFGSIDSIKKRGNGIFDVYYKVRELPNIPKILDSLNEVTFQHSRWLALPAPLLHPEIKENVLKRKEGQAWHLSQMSRLLKRIESGLDNVGVWFEDLKSLNSMEEQSRRS